LPLISTGKIAVGLGSDLHGATVAPLTNAAARQEQKRRFDLRL
jgi:hypothetical protein